jgi:hypothetical protein
MNVQLFDRNVRAILGNLGIYILSLIIYSYTTVWPIAIQYILIFISPYIAAHSIFRVRNFLSFKILMISFCFVASYFT